MTKSLCEQRRPYLHISLVSLFLTTHRCSWNWNIREMENLLHLQSSHQDASLSHGSLSTLMSLSSTLLRSRWHTLIKQFHPHPNFHHLKPQITCLLQQIGINQLLLKPLTRQGIESITMHELWRLLQRYQSYTSLFPREGTQFEFMNPDHARAMDKLELPCWLKKISMLSFQNSEGASIQAWACSSILQQSFGWEIDRNAPYYYLQSVKKTKRRTRGLRRWSSCVWHCLG